MAGIKTQEFLAATFADSFKREVDADEAVWRTLPFFGALIALAVAVLPPIYRSVATLQMREWRIAAYFLLGLSLLSFAVAAVWFWQVVRIRAYRYPASDARILEYAAQLDRYYGEKGKRPAERDEAVRDDLRAFLIEEFSGATTNNRSNNAVKVGARSKVLLFAMGGLLFAFLCEATILVGETLFWA